MLIKSKKKARGGEFNYLKFDEEKINDVFKQKCIKQKGFFIYPRELFENVRKNANTQNLNEHLANIFKAIESTTKTDNFSGIFGIIDLEFKNLKDKKVNLSARNELLKKIMDIVADMNLGDPKDSKIDIFGDAYEFLISMYAKNAGKSGGEFYTPQEVSTLLSKLALLSVDKKEIETIYDPACGSGSLLLRAFKECGNQNVEICGQEINPSTFDLCRMNMFLHNINYTKFDIRFGDTLKDSKFDLDKGFDIILSNPPYSTKWEPEINTINDERFAPAGVLAPKNAADMGFIMHIAHCLKSEGCAAVLCFPGILYRSGSEQKIRKYLIE